MKIRGFLFAVTLLLSFSAGGETLLGAPTSKTYVVTSAASAGPTAVGTLLWAIYQANYGGADLNFIDFNIPGITGETEITLTETLYIARPMVINATTQPGYTVQPLIRINCSLLDSGFVAVGAVAGIPPLSNGAPSTGTGSTIQGFRIVNYRSNAITILRGADSLLIAKNYIGFAPLPVPGTYFRNVTVSPLCGGIGIQSDSNVIRGNTISGTYNAIVMGEDIGNPAAITGTIFRNNVFEGNFIGTDPTGTTKIGNDSDGIFFGAGCQQNLIGPGNVLSGNASAGVEFLHQTATGNRIFGNMIGLNAAGMDLIANGELGVLIANGAANNWVGGPYGGTYAGNVISGNGHGGVAIGTAEYPGIDGSNNNHVEGNFIGTDAADTKPLGTQISGVTVQNKAKGNTIRRNVIVGQTNHGIVFSDASNNQVYGNWIGVTDKGTVIPNLGFGVYLLDASDNIIQPLLGTVGPGTEQNILGTNTLGSFGLYGNSLRNVIDLTPPPPPTATPVSGLVANVSTRLPVGKDDSALIQGFIVQGPVGSTKKIIVRAIGPSLIPFGITDAVANPTLEIFDANNAKIASNDNWKTTQVGGIISGDQFAEINGSGVAPSNDFESAIIANLAPGAYTAAVRGAGNSVGIGVVDAFDLSAGSTARLANIATRGLIQPGDKLMIAGFIVQNGPVRIVVRAIGPSLAPFGIPDALPDTTLELRDQQGTIIGKNDDWMSDQKAELEATSLQPSNNLEAALVQTIPPGLYTAQVRGKPETTGTGVVQIYFLQ